MLLLAAGRLRASGGARRPRRRRQAQADPGRGEYLIGPQDVLTVTVWDSPDLSGKFTVETDGSFTFPLIGRVKAGGLTLRQFEAELKKKLADGYFKNPQVSVAVETYRSQRIFIVGEVRNPGTYPLTGDMTLIEAIARAGSTTPERQPRGHRRPRAGRESGRRPDPARPAGRGGRRRSASTSGTFRAACCRRTSRCVTATPSSCRAPSPSTSSAR